MVEIGERKAVISGVGQSPIGRRLGRSALDLTVDAVLAAIEHAGLTVHDIDGVSTWPGQRLDGGGSSPCGVGDLREALRFELNWYSGGGETPGQFGAIFNAIAAVATGYATHVVCFRSLTEATSWSGKSGVLSPGRISGRHSWQIPFNAHSAACWVAMYAHRHMHEFGTTREQLAQIALTERFHASLNPSALYRDPLSLDDYMAARMISSPLCLFDCDVPIDGSTAVVLSRADRAGDLRAPVRVEAVGAAQQGRDSWDQWHDLTTMNMTSAARGMWARSELTPADVDLALLYDGFSILALFWLEALGFCGHGEGGAFISDGRIRLDGQLPVNTHGGQLSAGRTHGFGFLHEAVVQLRGEAGERQVADAQVAVAAAGAGPPGSGCLLLTTA